MLALLADEDLNGAIVRGVLRKLPTADFLRVVDVGLQGRPDNEVLEFAATANRVVVTHDVNTMIAEAIARVARLETMPGVIAARQTAAIGAVIDDLVLILMASTPEDFSNQVTHLPL